MAKLILREQLKARREVFAKAQEPFVASQDIANLPAQLRAWIAAARCVSAYAPIGGEADPLPLLTHAHDAGCETALPFVSNRTVPMRFLRWCPGESLVAGPMGLQQPDPGAPELAPDLIITPLLGFDRRLHRIGYGAGFYDRAFAALPAARKIGLAWSVQEVDAVPDDDWDVPLDAIWTEREWITNGENR